MYCWKGLLWLGVALGLSVLARASSISDNPIVGDEVVYLDGKWKATSSTPGPMTGCDLENDTDYNQGETAEGEISVDSPQECCAACGRKAGCVAGVFWQGVCYYKSQSDISKKMTSQGRVACKPSTAPASVTQITANVPGDLLTDLQTVGLIGDPLYELNFLNTTYWGYNVWNYSTTVQLTAEHIDLLESGSGGDVLLVFDGIKIGAANDQFLRYKFSMGAAHAHSGNSLLRVGSNSLLVSFDPGLGLGSIHHN